MPTPLPPSASTLSYGVTVWAAGHCPRPGTPAI